MRIEDPDATATSRRRRRVGGVLLALGAVSLGPALGAAAVAGTLASLGGPLAVAGGVALLAGVLLRRGTPPVHMHTDDLRALTLIAPDVRREGRAGLSDALQRQARLLDRLEQTDDPGQADRLDHLGRDDATRTVARVRWQAVRDLAGADHLLEGLLIDSDDGSDDVTLAAVEVAQARAEEAIGALVALADAMTGGSDGRSRTESEHQRAVEEVRLVTEWVTHRQQALRDLTTSTPPRRTPGQR